MQNPQITISDLYEGAYLLCRGFHLEKVAVIGNNGKKLCTFTFGEGAGAASQEYRQGRATANVALLKFTMTTLKKEMYKKIEEIEIQESRKEKKACSASLRRRR